MRRHRWPALPVTSVAYKAAADVVSKAVTLLVSMVAARVLSGAEFGVLAVAMTTGWILSVASDAGLPLYLARRIAQAAEGGGRPPFALVAEVMRLRLLMAAAAAMAGAGLAMVIAPRPLVLAFLLIVVAQLVNAVLETLAHAFRGLGRIDVEARLTLAQRSATGLAACAALLARPSLVLLAAALVVPPMVALAVAFGTARRLTRAADHTGAGDHERPEPALSARFARDVAPVGLGILLSALYFRCDVYFVEHWHGLETVGQYNAAFRIVEALRLFPAALMAVVFPALCNARTFAPLRRNAGLLLGFGALLTPAVFVAAPGLLALLFGPRFVDAAPALRVLSLALPLFFVNYALTHQLIAWDGQRAYLGVTVAALVTNLAANALLIPLGGMRGAAEATLITELVVAAGCATALAWRAGHIGLVPHVARAVRGDSV